MNVFLMISLIIFLIFLLKKIVKISIESNTEEIDELEERKIFENLEIKKYWQLIEQKKEIFLKHAVMFDFLGELDGEKVYRYLYNDGILYVFDDFLPENKKTIGLDENKLCFDRKKYVKCHNPIEILNKFEKEIKKIQKGVDK